MITHSYLEYFLTLLGWSVNNGIWSIITSTGIFAFPLLAKLIGVWLKARGQGADEGDQGGLALTWFENVAYMAMIVIMFTCVPLITVDLNTIQYDISRSKQCGYTVAQPSESGYSSLTSEIGGKTAAVPVWWYLVHSLSKGVTNAASSTLPCQPDLRQIRFEVQHTRISDPTLAQELQDFVQECYAPSLARLKMRESNLKSAESTDVSWIGSQFFINTPGYYDTDRARSPRSAWPYNTSRDAGLFDAGTGGYPSCKQWWSDSTTGIKDRTLKLVQPSVWQQLKKLGQSKAEYEEAVLRSLVSPRNMQVSQDGRVYPGFGGNIDGTLANAASRTAATVGQAFAGIAAFPAFDSMRQALPMVQAILLMALIICIPLIIVFSAYDIKTVVTVTFAQFALIFLTFWWDLARWLDSWLLGALYDSDTHSSWNLAGIQNSQDDLIINFVMGTMFLVLPAFWMSALGWAGVRVGGALENAARAGTQDARAAGGKGGDVMLKAGSSFKK